MPLLAVDVGNAHTVLGLIDGGAVSGDWRVATLERRTADEWAVLLRGLLGRRLADVDGIALGSTVPAVTRTAREMLARHFDAVPHVVLEPGVRTGLAMQMDNPREIGADRIANSVALVDRFGGPAIAVDFGSTATILDVVDPTGRYVGGCISAGMEISLRALGERGAQLRQVEPARPRSVIAKNTVEALQSGLLFGVAAQVEGLVARMARELGDPDDLRVVSTGYLAPLVIEECACFTDHDPWLTLKGLELVFRRNV
ncbi:type III pantothenate kinase [Nocardioides marinquilinus]|uniref:Type III pantothenate kinase n=1 Tax=Nocardioides marinquilinus TaxID=1210400 RepID=A0ABP9PDD6_9ACTN